VMIATAQLRGALVVRASGLEAWAKAAG